MTRSILGGTDMSRSLTDQINSVSGDGDKEKIERERLRSMLAANNVMSAQRKGGKSLTDQEIAEIEKKAGARAGSAMSFLREGAQASVDQAAIDRREALMTFGKGAASDTQRGQAMGYLDQKGNLTGDAMQKIWDKAGEKGLRAIESMNNLRNLKAKGTGRLTDAGTEALARELQGEGAKVNEELYGMSVSELKKMADAQREIGDYGAADQLSNLASSRERNERTLARRGGAGAANLLGIKVGYKDEMSLRSAKAGDGRLAAYLGNQLGIGTVGGIDEQLKGLESDTTKEGAARRDSLLAEKELAKKLQGIDSAKDDKTRSRLIDELKSDPAYRAKEEEKQKKSEMADPQLKYLSGIEKGIGSMKDAINALAGSLTGSGGPGVAPQPGAGGQKGK